jgi:hypothetical protein
MVRNPYYIWLCILIVGTTIGFVGAWRLCWIDADDWVGWIQAVGSVEAIIAAALVAQGQHWLERQKQKADEQEERRALILELTPQLIFFQAWLSARVKKIESIKSAKAGESYAVSGREFLPNIPRALEGPNQRLLLLPGKAGISAVQLRELLFYTRDLLREWANRGGAIEIHGPNANLSAVVATSFNAINSMPQLIKAVLTVIEPDHEKMTSIHGVDYKTSAAGDE